MKDHTKSELTFLVTTLVTLTLCLVVCCMVFTLMYGLFRTEVDNAEVFKLISPAFQTIVGGFIGLLSGMKLGEFQNRPKQEETRKETQNGETTSIL